MPVEANKVQRKITKLPGNKGPQSITSLESWQITKFCNDWANKFYEESNQS